MPSNKETLFQDHICAFLESEHKYVPLSKADFTDKEYHIIDKHLVSFITETQPEKYTFIQENYGADTDREILKALKEELTRKTLWLIMRDGLDVKGTQVELYKPKPRSATSPIQEENYKRNIFSYSKEYYYNVATKERIDLVIWLNGLPIIVIELKHEDEGQTCEDAIFESFLTRDLENNIYKLPFLYVASSNTEVKVATNPGSENFFRWFNAQLVNKAETEGEYPVEHLYRHALSKENIAKYLEHYLVFVPAKEEITDDGEIIKTPSFTIFPRYHQLRASKLLSEDVKEHVNTNKSLGKKYLINHSAGAGKTLTIAWMADLLDSLYTDENEKIFDNIIILTDRRSLDKNVKDDLQKFTHLGTKINFTKKSGDLAKFLDKNRAIIVTTIHKFGHIQDKLQSGDDLKNRKVAFLIDEAHRSQDGKLALKQRQYFNSDEPDFEDGDDTEAEIEDKIKNLNTSNQVFVAFTATTTPKAVSFFGDPFDSYTEDEAIKEGYILDVAQNIISYETLYNLRYNRDYIPKTSDGKDFPAGVVSKALKTIAFNDDDLIQYKSEVIVKLFEEKVKDAAKGRAKAMVVASSRPAGLKYFNMIKTILEEKGATYKVLFAFSDYTDPVTNEQVEEIKVNELDTKHSNKVIEDVFDTDDYRILVVANKFQTGFDQPLLSAMFLDKAVNGVNAIQTVSRLNRKHDDKGQEDILVVDFTNNSKQIFEAFNKHRKGSPFKEKEPDKNVLPELYNQIIETEVFSEEEIETYIKAYMEAEEEARKRNSTADALLSNLNQDYRTKFKTKLPSIEDQKSYIGLLRRFTNLFYFVAQFFVHDLKVNNFIVFAEVMADTLIKKGKNSELKQLLKNIELTKGAVKFHGTKANIRKVKEPKKTGVKILGGGQAPPRTTIEEALAIIEEKYQISKEDAIVIKEICDDVSKRYDIRQKITQNRNNEHYLKNNAVPRVKAEVKEEYMNRDLWEKLEDPIYTQKGGIISLMGKTIIKTILGASA
ncbi:DEAD/DEAH box helicase family protein [Draconibacterium sp. IB214405]|uniref:DEAD/DEAH box helicase family protein n=1 Tax=Draconibacterium sp. IB214405 TaxID=3097352 RepID=UPI002A17F6BD|nr:DEAD/DEAH box helicase family protein [Draconibacterium sp. IB214405]MDX8341562.1 DEAD/DEAH box helicase family protein [Draconibacterium sp. IB214405]